nr:protein EXORDIUM-like 3 [Ipomoea batatas]GMD45587.1 protein EXORDIUM-like 3 [Ipomoea batatas]
MISVIAHEIAELSTNPLVNAWYVGQNLSFPFEITNLCEGIYYTCGGGGGVIHRPNAGSRGGSWCTVLQSERIDEQLQFSSLIHESDSLMAMSSACYGSKQQVTILDLAATQRSSSLTIIAPKPATPCSSEISASTYIATQLQT